MHDKDNLFANVGRLIKAAGMLQMPVVVTEQVPDKLGATVSEITAAFTHAYEPIAKATFSCWGCEGFRGRVEALGRREIILCGIETHVCVSQTALDMLHAGFRVGCVSDATSARTSENKAIGLQRMQAAGTDMVSSEMIVTELLKTSAHPGFRDILNLIK